MFEFPALERFYNELFPVIYRIILLVSFIGTLESIYNSTEYQFVVAPVTIRLCFLFNFSLPPLSVPSFSRISKIFPDAFVIAVVIFATNISLAKMFAKKRGYSVDPNQVCLEMQKCKRSLFLD